MADGSVVIDIMGNDTDIKSKLANISKTAKDSLEGAGSALTSVGTKLTAAVTVPLIGATTAAAKWGIGIASAGEQAEIAFTTMLGSSEAAQDMMNKLADFAAKTPFELSGLTSASQKLLAYGFNAEQVIPMLTAVGDATAGLGAGQQGIDSITRALGQMQAKGKASAEEMLQLTEAGVPAWQMLADKVSNGDVQKAMDMVKKGAIDSKTAITALQEGMEQKFGGMMAEQATTLTGILSNMSDAAEGAVRSIYKTDAWKNLSKAMGGLAEQVGSFVEKLMPAATDLLQLAADKVNQLTDFLKNLSQDSVSSVIGTLKLLAGTGPAFIVMGKSLQTASKLMQPMFSALGKISSAAQKTGKFLSKNFGAQAKTMAKQASVQFGLLKTYVAGSLSNAMFKVKEFNTFMLRHGKEAFGGFIKGAKDSLVGGLSSLAKTMSTGAQNMWKAFSSYVSSGGIQKSIGSAFSSIKSTMTSALSSAFSGISGVVKHPIKAFSELGTSVKSSMAILAANVKVGLESAKGGIANFAATLKSGIGGAVTSAKNLCVSNLATIKSGFEGLGKASFAYTKVMSTGLTVAATGVVALAGALGGMLVAAATTGTDLSALGTSIRGYIADAQTTALGMISAVSSALPQVTSFLTSMAPQLAAQALNLVRTVLSAVESMLPQLGEVIAEAIPLVTETLMSLLPMLVEAALVFFGGLLQGLALAITSIVENLPAFIEQLNATFAAYGPMLVSGAQALFQALVDALPVVFNLLISQLPTWVNNVAAALPGFVGTLFSAAVKLFNAFVDALPTVIPAVVGGLITLIGNLILELPKHIPEIIEGMFNLIVKLGEGIVKAIPEIVSKMGELVTKAGDEIKNTDWAAVGKNIIDGLVNGIKNFGGAVVEGISGVVGNAIDGAKKLLGIHSPSRVFRQIGNYTGEGLVLGITDTKASVMRAVANLSQGVIEEGQKVQLGIPALTSSINSAITSTAQVRADGVFENLGSRIDAMSERLEEAMAMPVDITYNARQFGRMVREAVPAR